MAYLDNSGLYRKYGLEQVVPMAGGEYRTVAEHREIEFKIDLTSLGTAPAIITGTDNIMMPAGMRIEEVTIVNEVAATSGGSAVLNIGLVQSDRTTAIDVDGVVKVAPLADWDTLGERKTYTVGVTGAGDMIGTGTTGTLPGHFTADYDTAAFTAGTVVVRVKYRKV